MRLTMGKIDRDSDTDLRRTTITRALLSLLSTESYASAARNTMQNFRLPLNVGLVCRMLTDGTWAL